MNPWFHLLCKQGAGSGLGSEASHTSGKGSVKAEQVFLPELAAPDISASKRVLSELSEKTKKCASLSQQLCQRALIKSYKRSLLILAGLMDTTMLSAEPSSRLPAEILGTGKGCGSTPCIPHGWRQAGDNHHTLDTAREPRDPVTANKEQSGDNLFGRAPRPTWLSSHRVSTLIKKTKISTTKAVGNSHITANATRDRRTGKSSCLALSPTSGTSLSSSKHPPSHGCIAKLMWRELMVCKYLCNCLFWLTDFTGSQQHSYVGK